MFIHTVYFWLRSELSDAQQAQFRAGLASLTTISSVQHGYWGTPASTNRPIIERGYSAGLVVLFADQAAHDAYQVDPVHDQFRDTCSSFWEKVVIYDTITE